MYALFCLEFIKYFFLSILIYQKQFREIVNNRTAFHQFWNWWCWKIINSMEWNYCDEYQCNHRDCQKKTNLTYIMNFDWINNNHAKGILAKSHGSVDIHWISYIIPVLFIANALHTFILNTKMSCCVFLFFALYNFLTSQDVFHFILTYLQFQIETINLTLPLVLTSYSQSLSKSKCFWNRFFSNSWYVVSE